MTTIARFLSGRITAWITLAASVVVVGLLFAVIPSSESDAFPSAGLPDTAESARVSALLEEFPSADATVGILVWSREGADLTDDDLAAITERASALATVSTAPQAVSPQVSDDGAAALVVVPLDAADVEDDVAGTATELRELASDDLPSGLDARLTGPVGFQDDVAGAFAGADVRLLLITVIVVAVLLIVTYRSPVLWIVPLAVVGTADGLARVVVTGLADAVGVTIDASIGGILSVLVFGAGTNYALLLVARYREELLVQEDRHAAMTTAVRSAGPAIAASGGTVALSLLTLLFASLSGNQALGFACAVGVVIAILFALIVLPAALVVCGRGLFWPFIPRVAHGAHAERKPGFWTRLGRGVSRRPAVVAVSAVVGIGVLLLGLGGYTVGLSQTDQFLGSPDSVLAQETIDESFSAGLTSSTTILTPDDAVDDTVALVEGVDGVDTVQTGESNDGFTALSVTLDAEPESAAAFDTIRSLRSDIAEADGDVASALVGGSDATALDTNDAAAADLRLIVPIILAIVFVILALLLRSLVAPVLLILSVLATFFASLGAGNWIFLNLLGFPAFDANVTLYAFLFLVALGVDYNIFLTTRAREERARFGTREGMIRALSSTGGVITSAGILLAAVFAVLGVLPVVALTQVGIIVCIGVLLDTLVVRTVLVPALVFLTGDAFWWPSTRRSVGAHGDVSTPRNEHETRELSGS
ncbi:RND superfamily putative drug exporter [Labedella gwakjiensis]|uniref:MMPL family transporter n=1 Tax=Labedella gwakjiensis TaxID=390269 RepID=A0A2P8GXC9_9MICO|nr:MMPL family transporter [Labedella gwakjiensis]PSL38614.1 RND superfamily putative drug exporter [Labedella gwakjiensis]RUQ86882.1 MMPL family transporter [Labedella gwakjiensis]